MAITADFGRAVRIARETKGLSQEQLADIAKVHRTYLSGIETGSRNPTLEVVDRLARALGVSPATLLESRV